MAKNKIQFQRGLSLARFLAKYGTEEQCLQLSFTFAGNKVFGARNAAMQVTASSIAAKFTNATDVTPRLH